MIALAAAAQTGPSPLWYATRGAGLATLVVLTASVVVGVGTATRWEGRSTPRFVTATLHRNLSILAITLLAVHILTTVLDPYAAIGVRDVLVPAGAGYRPVWLGLGVVAMDILIAVALSSALRRRIGPRAWRAIHWAAYASWPIAVVHGLGTGSDAQAPWAIGLTASCIAAVLLALADRLRRGRLRTIPIRLVAAGVTLATTAGIAAWAVSGPFQRDWAARAGTPVAGSSGAAQPTPVHTGSAGFSDALVGTTARDAAGRTSIALRDVADPALTVVVRPPTATETLPVLTVARGGVTVCSVPARAETSLYAVCHGTRLTIDLYTGQTGVTGRLSTSGPL